jgi:hypothetical protein
MLVFLIRKHELQSHFLSVLWKLNTRMTGGTLEATRAFASRVVVALSITFSGEARLHTTKARNIAFFTASAIWGIRSSMFGRSRRTTATSALWSRRSVESLGFALGLGRFRSRLESISFTFQNTKDNH